MLFNSWQFAIFFPVVFFLYYFIPHRYRYLLLLFASYYFYMSWDPELVTLIAATTVVTYACGRVAGKKAWDIKWRRLALILGVVLPLGELFFFKYFHFFSDQMRILLKSWSIPMKETTLQIILPVGISFYTFQALSYVIDVYQERIEPQSNLGYYALYISFFPQLVAGPIERSGDLMPQFFEKHSFHYEDGVYGLRMIVWGLFKKIVVADSICTYVDLVYGGLAGREGLAYLVATVLFAIQIYCDFSGYSDIALGTARMLGFRLTKNFNSPYFAKSIGEFWHRWHVSLSNWFRDYVYIPLGGNRVSFPRQCMNLMITFLLSGLWHGANWTFLAWGALFGIYRIVSLLTKSLREKVTQALHFQKNSWYGVGLRTGFTFCLVCIGWVFFRANSLQDALYVLGHSLTGITTPLTYLTNGYIGTGVDRYAFLKIAFCLTILCVFDIKQLKGDPFEQLQQRKTWVRWIIQIAFICMTIILSEKGIAARFIYFQF